MKQDSCASNDNHLVFSERTSFGLGTACTIFGLFAWAVVVFQLVRDGPNSLWVMAWGLLGLVLLSIGTGLLTSKKVIVDRQLRSLVLLKQFLFWQSKKQHALDSFHSVSWKPVYEDDQCRYVIELVAPANTIVVSQVVNLEDARGLTRAIGEFLSIQQEHWDTSALGGDAQHGVVTNRSYKRLMALAGHRPMKCSYKSNHKLVYSQGFDWLLILFGMLAGPLGILFLLVPWLGIEVNGMEDTPWAAVLIGGLFLALSLVFVFGRRGLTFDKMQGTSSNWWGLPAPIWVKRHSLAGAAALGWDWQVVDSGTGPHAVGRIYLVDATGKRSALFSSKDLEQIESLAHDVANFLGLPLVKNTAS
ncbi:MAG TPA: hypothetical protein PKD64_03910 [Pirellulaceae bacterium]|nr:hypothetical protein [Pirellulaceae bacterium]HMO91316.1 hypothetical protein [Pirellulaceae bacterium]HMP70135.1 hypothetical protein [Pirellulaceae bacterium]